MATNKVVMDFQFHLVDILSQPTFYLCDASTHYISFFLNAHSLVCFMVYIHVSMTLSLKRIQFVVAMETLKSHLS